MKRCWIGVIFLVVLLLGGILTTYVMAKRHTPIAELSAQAADCALQEDWNQAQALIDQARERWDESWGLSAALSDHEPMERINGLFAQLEVYRKAEDTVGYAAVCARLSAELDAIGEAHGINWWQLL